MVSACHITGRAAFQGGPAARGGSPRPPQVDQLLAAAEEGAVAWIALQDQSEPPSSAANSPPPEAMHHHVVLSACLCVGLMAYRL